MRLRSRTDRRAQDGYTLLEIVISSAILIVLSGSLVESVSSVRRITSSGATIAHLSDSAEHAVECIVGDLRASGVGTEAGVAYPLVFADGSSPIGAFAHAPAAEHAAADEPDHGPNREVVFLQPEFHFVKQDSSGVNWDIDDESAPSDITKTYRVPNLDGDGELAWSTNTVAYVLVTDPTGVNVLERRELHGASRVVARDVERVLFETNAQDTSIPLSSIRVRLWLRDRDDRGSLIRASREVVVNLRNG